MKLNHIIRKNLKLILRSKSSALIIMIAPLLVIVFAGMAFNNSSEYNVKVGYYASEYTSLVNDYVKEFENNYPFFKFRDEKSCIESIKSGEINTCVVFPANFSLNSNVTFYADFSKINLVYTVINKVMSSLSEKSDDVSLDLTNVLIHKLESIEEEVQKKKGNLYNVKEKQEELSKKISSISGKVSGLDLSFEEKDFNIADLEAANLEISTKVGYYERIVSTSESLIANIRSDLEEANYSNLDIERHLDNAEKEIQNLSARAKANSTKDLSALILNVKNNLKKVEEKLDKAGNLRSEISSELSEAAKVLDLMKTEAEQLEEGFDAIESNINSIDVISADTIVNPIGTRIEPVTVNRTHLSFLFPILLASVIMFVSLLLSTTSVISEKNSSAYFRNMTTPTKDSTFLLGTYLTGLMVMAIQLFVIILVSVKYFDITVSRVPALFAALALSSSFFILFGAAIGYIFRSGETAVIATISFGSLMLFVSDVILPLESMPAYIASLAGLNPFVITNNVLKKIIIFNFGLSSVASQMGILILYSIVTYLIIAGLQKMYRRNVLSLHVGRFYLKKKKLT